MSAQDALKALSAGFEALAAQASASVFHVGSEDLPYRTGVLIDTTHVLVPAAAAETGEKIELRAPDGSTVGATVSGYDPFSEFAVVTLDKATSAGVLEAGAPARLGQIVLTVAHASPEGPEVRLDMIRCVGGPTRLGPGLRIDSYLQTDGLPFPGFGGAPVIDLDGKLVGVVSSNALGNTGFIVPANEVLAIAKRLIEVGSPVRGYVGLRTKAVDGGLLVVEAENDGAAAKAGIRVGDILRAWDGHALKGPADLLEILASWKGGSVKVELSRGDASLVIEVEPAKRNVTRGWSGWGNGHSHEGHGHHDGHRGGHGHRHRD